MIHVKPPLPFTGSRILTRADGTFFRDPDGDPAIIVAVYDRDNELCDLIAWFPPDDSCWWLYYGDATPILGPRNLAIAAYFGTKISLHSTPERWALAGGRGAAILSWDADCRDLFEGVGGIEFDCPELETRFRRMLRAWEPPTVRPQVIRHAA